MERIEVIKFLERKYAKIYNGYAVNIGSITDKIMAMVGSGENLKSIELYRIDNILHIKKD
jgi:hypothetical protein